jgi:hypothetical protein
MWKLWLVLVVALLGIGSNSAAPWDEPRASSNGRHLLSASCLCGNGPTSNSWGNATNFFNQCFIRECLEGGRVRVIIRNPSPNGPAACDFSNVAIFDTDGEGTCLARQDGSKPESQGTTNITCGSSYRIMVKKGGGAPFSCFFKDALLVNKTVADPVFPCDGGIFGNGTNDNQWCNLATVSGSDLIIPDFCGGCASPPPPPPATPSTAPPRHPLHRPPRHLPHHHHPRHPPHRPPRHLPHRLLHPTPPPPPDNESPPPPIDEVCIAVQLLLNGYSPIHGPQRCPIFVGPCSKLLQHMWQHVASSNTPAQRSARVGPCCNLCRTLWCCHMMGLPTHLPSSHFLSLVCHCHQEVANLLMFPCTLNPLMCPCIVSRTLLFPPLSSARSTVMAMATTPKATAAASARTAILIGED